VAVALRVIKSVDQRLCTSEEPQPSCCDNWQGEASVGEVKSSSLGCCFIQEHSRTLKCAERTYWNRESSTAVIGYKERLNERYKRVALTSYAVTRPQQSHVTTFSCSTLRTFIVLARVAGHLTLPKYAT
jgi:hypothetical protein